MSTEVTDEEIEEVLLEVLRQSPELNPRGIFTIQQLCKYSPETLNNSNEYEQRRVLTVIYNLFLKGYLAWGHDFKDPIPPFCHITHRGKEMLKRDI